MSTSRLSLVLLLFFVALVTPCYGQSDFLAVTYPTVPTRVLYFAADATTSVAYNILFLKNLTTFAVSANYSDNPSSQYDVGFLEFAQDGDSAAFKALGGQNPGFRGLATNARATNAAGFGEVYGQGSKSGPIMPVNIGALSLGNRGSLVSPSLNFSRDPAACGFGPDISMSTHGATTGWSNPCPNCASLCWTDDANFAGALILEYGVSSRTPGLFFGGRFVALPMRDKDEFPNLAEGIEYTARLLHWAADLNDAPVIQSGTFTASSTAIDTPSVALSIRDVLNSANILYSDPDQGMGYCVYPGIAVTGSLTPIGSFWQYSTDSGTTWTNVTTTISDSSALTLGANHLVRINAGAAPGLATLSFAGWDGTHDSREPTAAAVPARLNITGMRGSRWATSLNTATIQITIAASSVTVSGTPASASTTTSATVTQSATTETVPETSGSGSGSADNSSGLIIGVVVGAVVLVLLCLAIFIFIKRRSNKSDKEHDSDAKDQDSVEDNPEVTTYASVRGVVADSDSSDSSSGEVIYAKGGLASFKGDDSKEEWL